MVMSVEAAAWATAFAQTYIGAPLAQGATTTTTTPGGPTNPFAGLTGQIGQLCTLVTNQVAGTPAGTGVPASKSGFDLFPIHTKRVVPSRQRRRPTEAVRFTYGSPGV